jgi:hypothetical protein
MFIIYNIREESVYGYGGWTDETRREFDIIGYFEKEEDAIKYCQNTEYDYEFVENLSDDDTQNE